MNTNDAEFNEMSFWQDVIRRKIRKRGNKYDSSSNKNNKK